MENYWKIKAEALSLEIEKLQLEQAYNICLKRKEEFLKKHGFNKNMKFNDEKETIEEV
jgi:hypothetical protein